MLASVPGKFGKVLENVAGLATGRRYRALVCIRMCERGRHTSLSRQSSQRTEANTRTSQSPQDFSVPSNSGDSARDTHEKAGTEVFLAFSIRFRFPPSSRGACIFLHREMGSTLITVAPSKSQPKSVMKRMDV